MKHTFGFFIIGLQLLVFSYWWFFSPKGAKRTLHEKEELKALEIQLSELESKKGTLEALLAEWEQDPFLIEKYAREHLGLSKTGEEILVL